jgi:uncharacterized protein YggE
MSLFRFSLPLRGARLVGVLATAAVVGALLATLVVRGGTDPANAATKTTGDRTIQVVGSGTVEVTPDRAILVAGVQVDGDDASQTASAAATKLNALIQAFRNAGIPAERLQSSGLQIDPRYTGDMQEKIVGFRASAQVTVTIDDVSKVGAILDAARGGGANQIQPVQWTLKSMSAAQRNALAEAAQDGIGQAGAVARGAGVGVGRLLSMSTDNSQGPQPLYDRAALQAAPSPGGDATPTAPGLIAVTATVTMTFAMS